MKNIAVIAYSLTIEYSLTIVDGVHEYFKDKEDVNLIVIPVKILHSTEFNYDYQYWSAIELLKSKSIDAVIVVTNSFLNFVTIDQLSKALEVLLPTPVISVSTPLNIPGSIYTCASCGNAYDQIVDHLVNKHGRKKIGFYSASLTNSPDSIERENAYKAALQKYGLEVDESLIFAGDYTPKTCYEYIVGNYISKDDIPFDAILCANDYMAVGCIGALQEIGISVPEDVCVVGFDDTEVAVTCNPTVSTINQQLSLIGFKAAEAAYKILEGESVPERNVIDSFPVYRQSCGCIAKNLKIQGYLSQDGRMVNSANLTKALNVFSNGLNDMDILFNHLNISDSSTNMNTFFDGLKLSLARLNIPKIALCTYDNPIKLQPEDDFKLPENANLIIYIDRSKNIARNYFYEEEKKFNLSDCLFFADEIELNGGLFQLIPIFHRESLYGYFFYEIPTTKYPLYLLAFKILSNAFVNSYEFSRVEQEKVRLAERNQNLNFAAKTDELTKLFNRRGFLEYGQQLLNMSVMTEKMGSVFFCDLDGLKKINDTWGHDIGDLAIKTEAKALRAAFRDSDMIGRLSGDEFAVVAPGFPPEKIDIIRERLREINEEFSKEADLPLTLSISIGAVLFDNDVSDLKELLIAADKELYEEKHEKHNR